MKQEIREIFFDAIFIWIVFMGVITLWEGILRDGLTIDELVQWTIAGVVASLVHCVLSSFRRYRERKSQKSSVQ